MTEEEKSRILAATQLSNLTSGSGGCTVPLAFYALVAAFVFLTLAGCGTTSHTEIHQKEMTEVSTDSASTEKVAADTTRTEHKTTEREKTETSKETHTEKRDSTVTVVDKDGNVIGWKEYHWLVASIRELGSTERRLTDSLSEYRSRADSLSYYRHIADSLSSVRSDAVEVVREKPLTWWQRAKIACGGWAMTALVLVSIIISWLVMKRLRRRAGHVTI